MDPQDLEQAQEVEENTVESTIPVEVMDTYENGTNKLSVLQSLNLAMK